jgi:chromosome segregation ATPase
MGLNLLLVVIAFLCGSVVSWLLGGRIRRRLASANETLAVRTRSLAEKERELEELQGTHAKAAQDLAERQADVEALKRQNENLAGANQQTNIKLSELERRIHDGNMWEAKYEKLLKERQEYAAKISELEKTKVELMSCEMKLTSAKKRIAELEATTE